MQDVSVRSSGTQSPQTLLTLIEATLSKKAELDVSSVEEKDSSNIVVVPNRTSLPYEVKLWRPYLSQENVKGDDATDFCDHISGMKVSPSEMNKTVKFYSLLWERKDIQNDE